VSDTFPRQYARTHRFTLGEPRDVSVSRDGRRVVFLRSGAGDDPVNALWVLDVDSATERLVADPRALLDDPEADDLPPEEQARRERAREGAAGITAYATDAAGTVVAFALSGRLFVGGLLSGRARSLDVDGPAVDPRPDPAATRVAYVSGPALRIAELDGTSWELAGEGEPDSVSWGSADFIAAEEMHRFRGYWWSPDGSTIAACRVDVADVDEWYIADPARPDTSPRAIRYPAAGTANPDVTLHLLGLDGSRTEVVWDRAELPYLAAVDWSEAGLVVQVQSRDQRTSVFLAVDGESGVTRELACDVDPAWVELVPGTPRLLADGTLLRAADRGGARRLLLGDDVVTPPGLQVRAVSAVGEQGVTFQANDVTDATSVHVWRRRPDGELVAITEEPGSHSAAAAGGTTVVRSATLDRPGRRVATLDGVALASHAEQPLVTPNVDIVVGESTEPTFAVLVPHDHDGSPLPVLVDPYGGPHALRVTRDHHAFLAAQWFADQGFAVIVADGRGTPGRGSEWERAVRGDLATAPLADQVDALRRAADRVSALDLDRVAIRGWSFGGYLAALAVLRRPDVFHAAIAGAPVTDWRLYDTHYTERYLGDPASEAAAYESSSLLALAPRLERPLLLVHGLADDNVVAAHTLRLSAALLAAGRPHEVLPLSGITHQTPQEEVAENLLLHQLAFLRRALGIETDREPG
jgi:dipeptidyl-peptidase-4